MVKTPVGTLLLFLLSFVALTVWKWFPRSRTAPRVEAGPCPGLYDLSPLLILGGVYGWICLTSHLDIGLRHILVLYPVLFILAGANVFWLFYERPLIRIVLPALLLGTVIESLAVWPNYLAFFNQFVGGPRNGYKYLVDSSLDWGQDLPGLHRWLEKNAAASSPTPVYLSYFGTGDPAFYHINALRLPGFIEPVPQQTFPLRGGVYCLSATSLQSVYSQFHRPWTRDNENVYGQVRNTMNLWNSTAENAALRNQLLQDKGAAYWNGLFQLYGELRLARLCAYLRPRAPDAEIGYSILIYRLTDDDINQALEGPSPEGQ